MGGGFFNDAYGPVKLYEGVSVLAFTTAIIGALATVAIRSCRKATP